MLICRLWGQGLLCFTFCPGLTALVHCLCFHGEDAAAEHLVGRDVVDELFNLLVCIVLQLLEDGVGVLLQAEIVVKQLEV